MSSIHLPVRIEFGLDSSITIGSEFRSLKCSKVMVVSDKGVINAGLLDKILKSLADAKVESVLYDNVVPDPDVKCVEQARDFYISERCDGILAVGGGSSIDTAKAAGALITNSEPIVSMGGMGKVKNPLPPLIAIPTTCGTGSEVTNVTVVTDEYHFKVPIISPYLIPKVAVLDPNLLTSLPPSLVAATGMDALTHAIEALTNKLENWYADMCAIKAIEMIGKAIRPAAAGGNVKALSEMLYASTLAGISFTLSRLGLVHAMSHPISGFAGVPHGVANAILLPYVMSFNLVGNPEGYALVAKALGIVGRSGVLETAKAGVEEVIGLNHQLGIPKSFKDVGVKENLFPQMITDTFKSGNVAINPRRVSEKDVEIIYQASFAGDSPLLFIE
ncbi:alcohol dehydrogenase [Effusibacillus lacus]|uniref:Alcohol dehydrogenase n=1 Tax=Effusibacillus lacus TaxID=1348429 RepID=A0A292YJA7_9BACL|nr:alcohol dehydrogenase [Effusibacillus lacus]